jgi:hypothetical protein
MPQGHLSGSWRKACNHTKLNKRGSVNDKLEKAWGKSWEKKKRVKYGLSISRKKVWSEHKEF